MNNEQLSRMGFDDATCNNGLSKDYLQEPAYVEGYRNGLFSKMQNTKDEYESFNKLYPEGE